MTLRVAFPYDAPADRYEPTRIHLGPEYIMLENIYSPLVELDKKNGAPVPGLAEEYSWVDGELHFKIRKGVKTVDGYEITAKDAEFSLKRVLILSGNTHGNFKDLICPDSDLKSIDEKCDGIEVRGDTLVLKPGEEKPFLVPMLAAIDFAVLPITSVDEKTLKITDYKNTSGPYFISSDDKKGHITLSVNKTHYNYAEFIPQEIKIVPSGVGEHKDAITQFENNEVDYITTIDKLNPEKIINFSRKNSDSVLHTSINIRTFLLTFTDKGLKKYSLMERAEIGRSVRDALRNYYESKPGYENTDQFFPHMGEGSLNDNQRKEVNSLFSNVSDETDKKVKISIIRLGKAEQFLDILKSKLPNAEVYEGDNVPLFKKYDDEADIPDCFISGPDTGFTEDIGLISYSMNAGFFGYSKDDGADWIKEYMSMTNKEERVEKLRSLHFESLSKAVIVPIVSTAYTALARKPWAIEISEIYANNPLWPIVNK